MRFTTSPHRYDARPANARLPQDSKQGLGGHGVLVMQDGCDNRVLRLPSPSTVFPSRAVEKRCGLAQRAKLLSQAGVIR